MHGIGEFSKIVNLPIDTLRYYEKEGILKSKRNDSNRRVFDSGDVKWIEFIKRLKKTGMPIKLIKKYAVLRYLGDQTIPERLAILEEQENSLESDAARIKDNLDFVHYKMNIYHEMLLDSEVQRKIAQSNAKKQLTQDYLEEDEL